MYKSIYLSKILLVRGSFHSSGLSKDSVFRLFSPAFHRNRPFHALWKELSSFPNLDFLPSFYLREEKLLEDYSIYSFNFNDSILLYIRDIWQFSSIITEEKSFIAYEIEDLVLRKNIPGNCRTFRIDAFTTLALVNVIYMRARAMSRQKFILRKQPRTRISRGMVPWHAIGRNLFGSRGV